MAERLSYCEAFGQLKCELFEVDAPAILAGVPPKIYLVKDYDRGTTEWYRDPETAWASYQASLLHGTNGFGTRNKDYR